MLLAGYLDRDEKLRAFVGPVAANEQPGAGLVANGVRVLDLAIADIVASLRTNMTFLKKIRHPNP